MPVGRVPAAVLALVGALLSSLLQVSTAWAEPDTGGRTCWDPTRDFQSEPFGPTDIGATLANPRLSVAVNPEGTVSVFRWPAKSFHEQMRYYTTRREDENFGVAPNSGAFSGLALTLKNGDQRVVWLRDLHSRQRYLSQDSDTVTTRFFSRALGLRLEVLDVVPQRSDVLMRRHSLVLAKDSPVRSAELLAFANLNPNASKLPVLPIQDWCLENRLADVANYSSAHDAIVYSITETDPSVREERSVAVAMGADVPSVGHQVGADPNTTVPGVGPQSAYLDAADGKLSGNDELGPTEVDAALSVPIDGRPVTVTFAVGRGAAAAATRLEQARQSDAVALARAKRRSYLRWLRDAPLPRNAPTATVKLARRSLVSMRQVIDTDAGAEGGLVAVVASLASQAPYHLDWVRDGAFFNELLDTIGHPELVTRHNHFYAEVQHKLEQGAPPGTPLSVCQGPTPDGNWFMTNYTDGGDAGNITWEIDETGFGVWTFWRHHQWLHRSSPDRARRYLERVYPALRRAADFLVVFRDPTTHLPPGTACEDDSVTPAVEPSMQSSGVTLLALRSATAAAKWLGRESDAQRYAGRRDELAEAIDVHYGNGEGAWAPDFQRGGWSLWPIKVKPYTHPRSRGQADVVWAQLKKSFAAPNGGVLKGSYEAKGLLGLAHYYSAVDPDRMPRVRRGLTWIADVLAGSTETEVLGEAWKVHDGEVRSIIAQPHVWEHALFYMTALEAYRHRPYAPSPAGRPLGE